MSILQTVELVKALQQGPQTANELAKHMRYDPNHMRSVLNKLVGAGYIETVGFADTKRGPKPTLYRWKTNAVPHQ